MRNPHERVRLKCSEYQGADAVYQNSGDLHSQWDHFVGRRMFYGTLPTINNGDTIGKSCDFWNR